MKKPTQPNPSTLTRTQVKGLLIMGMVLLTCTFFWRMSSVFYKHETHNALLTDTPKGLTALLPDSSSTAPYSDPSRSLTPVPPATLFPFDPNTASEQDFIRLGLAPRVAHTICKYRSKGGRFYNKEDLAKIYTLSASDYHRLRPYIRIAETVRPEHFSQAYSDPGTPGKAYSGDSTKPHRHYPVKRNQPVAINTCTEEDLMTLSGIGVGYAGRIIRYREVLGGFVDKEQLREVYGMTDSLYTAIVPYIIVQPELVHKLKLNTATEADWKKHPYTRKLASYILLYRKDNGSFTQIEDFRKVPLINEEKYRKIAPYLSL